MKKHIKSSIKAVDTVDVTDRNIFVSHRREETDNGYSENTIYLTKLENGSLYFTDDDSENFIYLYPEQIKHLRKVLNTRFKEVKKK